MALQPKGLSSGTIHFGDIDRTVYFREGTTDGYVFDEVFRKGAYNLSGIARWPEILAHLEREQAAAREALVIDAGANIGATSLFLAYMAPNLRIVAIEPQPDNFRLLEMNTDGLNCECLNAAVAGVSGTITVVDPGLGEGGFRTEEAPSGEGLRAYTMNELYSRYCTDSVRPFVAKIDIEGAEGDVFSKGLEWIEQTPVIMVELHDWMLPKQGTAGRVLKALADQPCDFLIFPLTIIAIRRDL